MDVLKFTLMAKKSCWNCVVNECSKVLWLSLRRSSLWRHLLFGDYVHRASLTRPVGAFRVGRTITQASGHSQHTSSSLLYFRKKRGGGGRNPFPLPGERMILLEPVELFRVKCRTLSDLKTNTFH